MSKQKNKYESEEEDSYFVVDNTGAYSVIYSDQGLNSKVQFVWKDDLKKPLETKDFEDEKNDYIPSYNW